MKEMILKKGVRIKPKYKILANELTRNIWNRNYYNRIPGLRELSKEHHVHLNTMAKAVNTLLEKGILYTKRGVGTFINEEMVKKRHLILWLVSEKWGKELGSLRADLIAGLRDGLGKCNVDVESRMIEMEGMRRGVWFNSFSKGVFQGVVTTGVSLKHKEDIKTIIEEGISCISLLYREEGINFVDADNVGGAYEAVKYLISLGHRNIAFLTGDFSAPNMRDNLLGYKKALEEKGIKYNERIVKTMNDLDDTSEITRGLLRDNPQITAIFTSGDPIAVEAAEIIKGKNLKVPEDISVVGFDDLPLGKYYHPSLTTVRQPFFEVGRLAADKLMELMEGKIKRVAEILPTELIIRDSCAPPKKI